jgi:hypothetical protein
MLAGGGIEKVQVLRYEGEGGGHEREDGSGPEKQGPRISTNMIQQYGRECWRKVRREETGGKKENR